VKKYFINFLSVKTNGIALSVINNIDVKMFFCLTKEQLNLILIASLKFMTALIRSGKPTAAYQQRVLTVG
jgi:hypothetical protein